MYQCVALAGDREPAMLLWERRAGGRGMPLKYLQPVNLRRPHNVAPHPTLALVLLGIREQVAMVASPQSGACYLR